MKTLPRKSVAAALLVLGAFGAASAAHARSDLYFSVGVQAPAGVYVQPAPVYVAPAPVHVAPGYRGEYRHPGAWERRGPYGDRDRDGIANVYDPDSPRNQRRHARLYGPYGDLDRDGIMNRDDRDLDGDGVRNRRDRFPQNPYRY